MSASILPAPPESSPEAPRPARGMQPERSGKVWPVVVFLAVFSVAAAWLFVAKERATPAAVHLVRTVHAARGSIENTLRLTGSIAAERYAMVSAPILQAPETGRGLVLIYLADSGSFVREGQVVARIDNQAIVDHLDDVEDQVTQLGLDLAKRKAQNTANMEYLLQQVRAAKAGFDKAMLDLPLVAVRPAVTAEQLRLSADEARAVYEELKSEVPLVLERQRADLKGYEIAYERQVRHRNRHKIDMIRCEIKAPMSGQVVLQTLNRHGEMNQIKVGDQIAPAQPFMKIIDPGDMLLDATMSQTESELLRIGQPAKIRFDAFPDIVLRGKVRAVGALAVSGRRVNYYVRRVPIRLQIEENDPRIIPDLTASADVVITEAESGVIVPREAIVEHEGKSLVFVKQAEAFERREVEVGGLNSTHAAVVAGLSGGEELSLEPAAGN